MIRESFCGACMRTVYRAASDNDACPVCSTPLLTTTSEVEVEALPETMVTGPLIPVDEELRLAAVARYEILDTPPDGSFDRITDLAARIFDVPISTITVVDHDRIWFKSKHGIDGEQIGRDPGLCASAIIDNAPWVVNDATVDPRTLDNPLVRGDLGLRFYAGAALTTGDGHKLGTLNIIDRQPREITDDELEILRHLADIVVDELELRLAALRLFRAAEERGVSLQ